MTRREGRAVPSASPENDRSHPPSGETSGLDAGETTLLKDNESGVIPKSKIFFSFPLHDTLLICIIIGPGPLGISKPSHL